MELIEGKNYLVIKCIKIHTKPDYVVGVSVVGMYSHETNCYYVFDGFKVSKKTIMSVTEIKNG